MKNWLSMWMGLTAFSFVGTYALHASNVQSENKVLTARRNVLLCCVKNIQEYMVWLEEKNIGQAELMKRMGLAKHFCESTLDAIHCKIDRTGKAAFLEFNNKPVFDQIVTKELEQYYNALRVVRDLYVIAHVASSPLLTVQQQFSELRKWVRTQYADEQKDEMQNAMDDFTKNSMEMMLQPGRVRQLCEKLIKLIEVWPSKSSVSNNSSKTTAEVIKL